jgi:hypothetical protein
LAQYFFSSQTAIRFYRLIFRRLQVLISYYAFIDFLYFYRTTVQEETVHKICSICRRIKISIADSHYFCATPESGFKVSLLVDKYIA